MGVLDEEMGGKNALKNRNMKFGTINLKNGAFSLFWKYTIYWYLIIYNQSSAFLRLKMYAISWFELEKCMQLSNSNEVEPEKCMQLFNSNEAECKKCMQFSYKE